MNCYTCKHRGTVPGSAHSRCNIFKHTLSDESKSDLMEIGLATHQFELTNKETGEPLVGLSKHGVKNGWANWPIDFDPVWVESCVFFKEKEVG